MDMRKFVEALTQFEREQLVAALAPREDRFPTLDEVLLCCKGNQVRAIVEYRRRTNSGLKEARDAIVASRNHWVKHGTLLGS